eukprot:scaffold3529_cov271-Amphora_coffeaeformis.AAC.2
MDQGDGHLYRHDLFIASDIVHLIYINIFLDGLPFFVGQNTIPITDPKRGIVGSTCVRVVQGIGKGRRGGASLQRDKKEEQGPRHPPPR